MKEMIKNYLVMAEKNKLVVPYKELERISIIANNKNDPYIRNFRVFVLNERIEWMWMCVLMCYDLKLTLS